MERSRVLVMWIAGLLVFAGWSLAQAAGPVLKPSKNTYAPDEPITVLFSGLPTNQELWLSPAQAGGPDDFQAQRVYTAGQASGKAIFSGLPAGQYEVRLYRAGGKTPVRLARVSLNVAISLQTLKALGLEASSVLRQINRAQIEALLQLWQHKYTSGDDGAGNPLVQLAFSTARAELSFFECSKGSCGSLHLSARIKPKKPTPWQTINDWNRSTRFSKAYLDKNGMAVLEADLDLSGGMQVGSIKTFLETFSSSLEGFALEIGH